MFRDGREGHVIAPGQIAHAPVPPGQLGKDAAPGGIGQSGEGAIKGLRIIFNHLVKYLACQNLMRKQYFGCSALLLKKRCEGASHSKALRATSDIAARFRDSFGSADASPPPSDCSGLAQPSGPSDTATERPGYKCMLIQSLAVTLDSNRQHDKGKKRDLPKLQTDID